MVSVLERNKLNKKLAVICADDCSTSFGSVKRKGKNNLFFKVEEKIERNLTGVGYAAHIVHNSIYLVSTTFARW